MNRGIKRQKFKNCAKLTDLFFKPPSAASASSTSASTNVQDTEQTDQGQGVKQEDSEDSQSLCILKLESSSPMGLQKCVLFLCM